ncbi:hypothetical protein THTE_2941 [Thermogutta terrifontis]|jgi:hypothetical protein|uniref:Uncharacterized protein n=1 Tax=Thermogutta terrifontis TaxID=1331910 RepID=A0A286RHW1_9BACT|nr:hypothetical protein THTE_2941 [Thermogutta terrifontis]
MSPQETFKLVNFKNVLPESGSDSALQNWADKIHNPQL